MTNDEIAEILAKPYAQQLVNGPEPARLAYTGLDGDPRVVPVGFWTEGERFLIATVPKSAKVAAIRTKPKVALTIDHGAFPPKALLIRGTAGVEVVKGVPAGYLVAGRKVMTEDQYPDWLAGVQALYDEMVVITIAPTWAKLLDFETTIPTAVEDLIKENNRATQSDCGARVGRSIVGVPASAQTRALLRDHESAGGWKAAVMINDAAKAHLHDHLRWVREALVWKLDGLSEYDVRRPLTATGTNLLGLVKHNAIWDSRYFGEVFDRPFPEQLPRWDDSSARGTDLWATARESRTDIVDLYRRVWRHTDATIEALDLNTVGHVPWWQEDVPLFNVMVHCLSDTTRHTGHADILREGLDGAVGVDAESQLGHSRDDAFWEARRAMIERIASEVDRGGST